MMSSQEDKRKIIDTEMPGLERKHNETTIKLGKKLNLIQKDKHLNRYMSFRGMHKIDIIAQWEHMIGKIYAEHSLPIMIKSISGVPTLICKVKYTRILEFQYQKENFIKQINLFAGNSVIRDIKFERTDKLPHKRSIPSSVISKSLPNETHPKLSKEIMDFENPDLQNALNVLAYLIMPLEKKDNKPQYIQESSNIINSWRERAKILLNSCDK